MTTFQAIIDKFPHWQSPDGDVLLVHGDALAVLPLIEAGSVDACIDPPYGLGEVLGKQTLSNKSRWRRHFSSGAPEWDATTCDAAVALTVNVASLAIVWGGQFYELPPNRGWLIWNKIIRNFSSGECELAWTNIAQPNRAFDYSHGQLASEGKHFHPTQKPLPLIEWCLSFIPNERPILDSFMGSATCAVACIRTGRKFLGVEIDADYFQVAVDRVKRELDRQPLFKEKPLRQRELIE